MRKNIMGFDQSVIASLSAVKTDKNGKTVTLKADYTDLAILRWFVDFQCSGKMTSIEVCGERYFFVSYKKLLDDMPLLDMSKQALYTRMQKLIALGLLKHHYHKEFGSQAFYCMGENYIRLIHSDETLSSELVTPSQENLLPPLKKTLDNSLITDRDIIDNNNPLLYPPQQEEQKTDDKKQIVAELKRRMNALFHRRESTTWSVNEERRLHEISRRNDVLSECSEIEALYNSDYPYRRRSLQVFLNNWATELDRARNRVDDRNVQPRNYAPQQRLASQIGNPVWAPDERGRQPQPFDID